MPSPPASLFPRRISLIRRRLVEAGLDAVLLTHTPNVFYLTGFRASNAWMLLTADALVLMTDARYAAEARLLFESASPCTSSSVHDVAETYEEASLEILKQRECLRIGFEAAHLPFSRYHWLATALAEGAAGATALVPTDRLIEAARIRKDPYEVEILRHAAGLLSGVAGEVLPNLRVGQTEREVAGEIDWALRRAGFERPAFETIVASGPNSGAPHARPGHRRLTSGDPVVLDFGGVYDGYCVDLTRTVCLGEPAPDLRFVYEAVARAQRAAVEAVRPGALPEQIDAAARTVLDRYDLARAFAHATGHGLGIELHEEPRIGRPRRSRAGTVIESPVLEAGMIFTLEPGVYRAGRFGVRIEDDVLVTEEGCEVLTGTPSELLVI